jgi:hypothetical protein
MGERIWQVDRFNARIAELEEKADHWPQWCEELQAKLVMAEELRNSAVSLNARFLSENCQLLRVKELAQVVVDKHRIKIAGKGSLWYYEYPSEEMEALAKELGY